MLKNRLYYALFYAVTALAYKKDFKTTKHSELLGWFTKNYLKTKKFNRELGKLYKKTYENRYRSDYTLTYIPDKQELQKVHDTVKTFISEIKVLIDNQ